MDFWLNTCHRAQSYVDVYSDDFLETYEKSDFFVTCKKSVEGKLKWREWSDCSVTCGGGIQTKIATSCVPSYAVCFGIQIKEQTCNEQVCPLGQWTWNNWSDCSHSCGGGMRIKIADKCSPEGASCEEVPIVKESCNENACAQGPSTFLPVRV